MYFTHLLVLLLLHLVARPAIVLAERNDAGLSENNLRSSQNSVEELGTSPIDVVRNAGSTIHDPHTLGDAAESRSLQFNFLFGLFDRFRFSLARFFPFFTLPDGGGTNATRRALAESNHQGRLLYEAEMVDTLSMVEQPFPQTKEVVSSASRTKPTIAIATMLGETYVEAYNQFSVYQKLAGFALQSILEYGSRHGYPVFFLHDFLMDKSRQAYWSKINVIKYYLSLGYDYVLYTDIDVIVLQPDKSLEDFIVPGRDVIAVNECKDRTETNDLVRSGFMMFKNTPATMAFLEVWDAMFPAYKDIENPEQTALEFLVKQREFVDIVHLHDWRSFHSYDTCNGGKDSFSMHFPGAYKLERMARMVAWLDISGRQPSKVNQTSLNGLFNTDPESRHLTTVDTAHGIVRDGLVSLQQVPLEYPLEPMLGHVLQARQALEGETYRVWGASRRPNVRDSDLILGHLKDTWRYDASSYFWPIPDVIYMSVKSHQSVHPDVQARIELWQSLNPEFDIIIHDDEQVNEIVLALLPIRKELWDKLEPVQRVDIYRYVVVHSFGGWYMDADVDPVRPVRDWGHAMHQTLVIGVEADNFAAGAPKHEGARPLMFSQYAFGAAPQHPALKWTLEKILDLEDDLVMSPAMTVVERLQHVLASTGPVVWTDTLFEFLVLSAVALKQDWQSPELLHLGGSNINARIFSVAGFGCGQGHSNSPNCSDAGLEVNVWHRFGGSQYFGGKRWQATE